MKAPGPTPDKQVLANEIKPSAIYSAQGSIVVNAPISSVYRRCLRFEEFPKLITAVKKVQKLDENHFTITLAFNNKKYEGMIEIMLQVPERRLAWRTLIERSLPGYRATGVVSFTSSSDQSTCVTVKVSSSFNGAVSRQIDKCLHNFKRLVEDRPPRSKANI